MKEHLQCLVEKRGGANRTKLTTVRTSFFRISTLVPLGPLPFLGLQLSFACGWPQTASGQFSVSAADGGLPDTVNLLSVAPCLWLTNWRSPHRSQIAGASCRPIRTCSRSLTRIVYRDYCFRRLRRHNRFVESTHSLLDSQFDIAIMQQQCLRAVSEYWSYILQVVDGSGWCLLPFTEFVSWAISNKQTASRECCRRLEGVGSSSTFMSPGSLLFRGCFRTHYQENRENEEERWGWSEVGICSCGCARATVSICVAAIVYVWECVKCAIEDLWTKRVATMQELGIGDDAIQVSSWHLGSWRQIIGYWNVHDGPTSQPTLLALSSCSHYEPLLS